MKNCAFKSLLAEAFEKTPLLPISANAYYGTVLHKLLELILKGKIKHEEEFNKAFVEQVTMMEENLKQLGFAFLIPLQKRVKDFGMKKILLKNHLRTISLEGTQPVKAVFHSEKWFESKDKMIGGKIDLIIETSDEIEILDFKTGEITQDILDDNGEIYPDVKGEYKEQLKIYAYLYFESTGKFPTKLTLINLSKKKFSVEFSQEECKYLFDEAKAILRSTNNCIETEAFLANPSKENCKYCLYRPACPFYMRQIQTDQLINDVSGLIQKVEKYKNGNVSLFLESNNKTITVLNLPFNTYEELNAAKNSKVAIFNLKKEGKEYFYSTTKTTMIYEQR